MPKVPETSSINMGGEGKSPLTSVDPTNLLMAAAQMQSQGSFTMPSAKDKFPSVSQKHPIRKLKVVK
jgi:hypothetical protein